MKLSEVRKTVITALGVVISLGSFALPYVTDLAPEYANIIGCVVGVATVVLNYLVPNETDDPERAIGRSVRVKDEQPVDTEAVTVIEPTEPDHSNRWL